MSFIYIWSFFILHLRFLAFIDNKWLGTVFILIIILITITIIITKLKSTNLFHFSQLTAFFKNIRTLKSKANSCLCFSLPSIILADFLGNRTLLKRVQKAMVCDLWLVDLWIHFVFFCVSRFVACDLTSNNDRLQNSRFFFLLKIRKKSAKRGVPESYAREAREPYTPEGHVRRNVRRLSQSPSPFSASFQTFWFTTRAYFKTPKYGLFCSLYCREGWAAVRKGSWGELLRSSVTTIPSS